MAEKHYGTYVEALISTTPHAADLRAPVGGRPGRGLQVEQGADAARGREEPVRRLPRTRNGHPTRRVGQTRYPNLAPEGFTGRFLYVNANWTFN